MLLFENYWQAVPGPPVAGMPLPHRFSIISIALLGGDRAMPDSGARKHYVYWG